MKLMDKCKEFFKRFAVSHIAKQITGITPKGYYFMNYCKEVLDSNDTCKRIVVYDEDLEGLIKNNPTIIVDRMSAARHTYEILNAIYKDRGIDEG